MLLKNTKDSIKFLIAFLMNCNKILKMVSIQRVDAIIALYAQSEFGTFDHMTSITICVYINPEFDTLCLQFVVTTARSA